MKFSFLLLILVITVGCKTNFEDSVNGAGTGEAVQELTEHQKDQIYCAGKESEVPFAGGDGSALDPYTICTIDQFNRIGSDSNLYTKNFALKANLDFSSVAIVMIADETNGFDATFDGRDHTLSNISISQNTMDYIGVFRRMGANGVLKNIKIVNASVTGRSYTGALLGHGAGIVENCHSSGVVNGATRVGGLIGRLWGTVEGHGVFNSSSSVNTTGTEFVGGLVGWSRMTKFENDFATGNVVSGPRAGGLIGIADQIYYVENSYATGNVSGGTLLGGLVGGMIGDIRNSYSTGNVNSNNGYTGGVAGTLNGNMSKSYSSSFVKGTASAAYGGLVGYMYPGKALTNSYFIGSINATDYVAGLIGYNAGSAVSYSFAAPKSFVASGANKGGLVLGAACGVTCFWDSELSGIGYDNANIATTEQARTTTEMKTASMFTTAGYDSTIWNIVDGSYPVLK